MSEASDKSKARAKKEALIQRIWDEMKIKTHQMHLRHAEVQKDKSMAESQNCAVTAEQSTITTRDHRIKRDLKLDPKESTLHPKESTLDPIESTPDTIQCRKVEREWDKGKSTLGSNWMNNRMQEPHWRGSSDKRYVKKENWRDRPIHSNEDSQGSSSRFRESGKSWGDKKNIKISHRSANDGSFSKQRGRGYYREQNNYASYRSFQNSKLSDFRKKENVGADGSISPIPSDSELEPTKKLEGRLIRPKLEKGRYIDESWSKYNVEGTGHDKRKFGKTEPLNSDPEAIWENVPADSASHQQSEKNDRMWRDGGMNEVRHRQIRVEKWVKSINSTCLEDDGLINPKLENAGYIDESWSNAEGIGCDKGKCIKTEPPNSDPEAIWENVPQDSYSYQYSWKNNLEPSALPPFSYENTSTDYFDYNQSTTQKASNKHWDSKSVFSKTQNCSDCSATYDNQGFKKQTDRMSNLKKPDNRYLRKGKFVMNKLKAESRPSNSSRRFEESNPSADNWFYDWSSREYDESILVKIERHTVQRTVFSSFYDTERDNLPENELVSNVEHEIPLTTDLNSVQYLENIHQNVVESSAWGERRIIDYCDYNDSIQSLESLEKKEGKDSIIVCQESISQAILADSEMGHAFCTNYPVEEKGLHPSNMSESEYNNIKGNQSKIAEEILPVENDTVIKNNLEFNNETSLSHPFIANPTSNMQYYFHGNNNEGDVDCHNTICQEISDITAKNLEDDELMSNKSEPLEKNSDSEHDARTNNCNSKVETYKEEGRKISEEEDRKVSKEEDRNVSKEGCENASKEEDENISSKKVGNFSSDEVKKVYNEGDLSNEEGLFNEEGQGLSNEEGQSLSNEEGLSNEDNLDKSRNASKEEGGKALEEEGGNALDEEGGNALDEEGGNALDEEGGNASKQEEEQASKEEDEQASKGKDEQASKDEDQQTSKEESEQAFKEEDEQASKEEGEEVSKEEASKEGGEEASKEEGEEASKEEGEEASKEEGEKASKEEGGNASKGGDEIASNAEGRNTKEEDDNVCKGSGYDNF